MWLSDVKQNLSYFFRITLSANFSYVNNTNFLLQKHITISIDLLRLKNTRNNNKIKKKKNTIQTRFPQREKEEGVYHFLYLAVSMEKHIISWPGYIQCQISCQINQYSVKYIISNLIINNKINKLLEAKELMLKRAKCNSPWGNETH